MINTSIKAYADKRFLSIKKKYRADEKGFLWIFLSTLNTDNKFLPPAESCDCQVSILTSDSHVLEAYFFASHGHKMNYSVTVTQKKVKVHW